MNAPCHPKGVLDIIPLVASPMCLTEEYAMSAFTSVCRRQINLVIVAPTREMDTMSGERSLFSIRNLVANRRSPYLPNFRRIPAKIIDPATGASTWALGSQR